MTVNQVVRVDVTGTNRSAQMAIGRTRDDLRGLGDAAKAASGPLGGLGGVVAKIGAGIAAGGAIAQLGGWIVDATNKASDLNETVSKTDQVFGRASQGIQKWARTTPAALSMSQTAILDTVSGFDLLLGNKGITGSRGRQWSKTLTSLSADLSSFFNRDASEAAGAINAALKGEMDPIEAFGVTLDEATLKARAYADGLYSGKGALSANAKIQATYAEILRQTGKAQGDLLRTAGGPANQMRQFDVNMEALSTTAGKAFTPLIEKYMPNINKWLRQLNSDAGAAQLADTFQDWADKAQSAMPTIQENLRAVGDAAKQMGDWAGSAFDAFNDLSPEAKSNIALIVGAGAALSVANRNPVVKMGVELVGGTVQTIASTVAAAAASKWFSGRFAQNVNVLNWPKIYPDGDGVSGSRTSSKVAGKVAAVGAAALAALVAPMVIDMLPQSSGWRAATTAVSEGVTAGAIAAALFGGPVGWGVGLAAGILNLERQGEARYREDAVYRAAQDRNFDVLRRRADEGTAEDRAIRGRLLDEAIARARGVAGLDAKIRSEAAARRAADASLRTSFALLIPDWMRRDGAYSAVARSALTTPTGSSGSMYWRAGGRLEPTPVAAATQVAVYLDGREIAARLAPVVSGRRRA